jgi:hypothetical protein
VSEGRTEAEHKDSEGVAKFRYLGTTLTGQNCIHEDIKSRLYLGTACLLKVKIYKTIILLVVLYGCETWSLTLRKEHRLRVFENRFLRRKFGPKRDEVTGSCTTRA